MIKNRLSKIKISLNSKLLASDAIYFLQNRLVKKKDIHLTENTLYCKKYFFIF